MSSYQPEKRLDPRFAIKIPATLSFDKIDTPPVSCTLPTRDLSAGGVYLHTVYDIPLGTRVEVNLKLPFKLTLLDAEAIRVSTRGAVIRCTAPGTGGEEIRILFNQRPKNMIGYNPLSTGGDHAG